jgi:hypothetical protein
MRAAAGEPANASRLSRALEPGALSLPSGGRVPRCRVAATMLPEPVRCPIYFHEDLETIVISVPAAAATLWQDIDLERGTRR